MAASGVLNSWETVVTKSFRSDSMLFNSCTIRLKLSVSSTDRLQRLQIWHMNRKVSVCYLLSGRLMEPIGRRIFDQRSSDSAILNARLLKMTSDSGKFGPKIRKTSCLSIPLVSSETKYPVSIGINGGHQEEKDQEGQPVEWNLEIFGKSSC